MQLCDAANVLASDGREQDVDLAIVG